MRETIQRFCIITTTILLLTIFGQPLFAGIVWTGDIDPADPMAWTSSVNGYVGKILDGTLDIDDGSIVTSNWGYIGEGVDSTGQVTVEGVDSAWINEARLYVGNYGNGILDIKNGGMASNTTAYVGYRVDSTGYVTVQGPDSQWDNTNLVLGVDGKGTLDIKAGGTVSCNSGSYIGYNSLASGHVVVTGAGSKWTDLTPLSNPFSLTVGYNSNGTLDILNGGVVDNVTTCTIGYYATSTSYVTVDGADSELALSQNLTVGLLGNGTVEIANGGAVNDDYAYIGSNVNSVGEITIDGAGSSWTSLKSTRIGYYGNGTMIIKNGAVVINEWECYIGAELGSTGDVTVIGPGSTWNSNDPLHVGRYGSGTLTITNGGLVSVDNALTIDTDGDGDGFVYMMSGGQLAIDGNANGTITGYLALVNGSDAIKYWNGVNWAGISDSTEGVDYTLEYLTTGNLTGYTLLTVHAPGPPDPDVDRDGGVDMRDFVNLASHWLEIDCEEPDWCGMADIDYSGDVGLPDLQILTEHWLEGVE